jgi:GNAT superfamily N-acetyltransferase
MTLDFTVDPELTDELRAEIVACWTDVTNSGGAVGFVGPVTMDDVAPVAAKSFAGVDAGYDRLLIGRANDRLAALAFVTSGQFALTEHWRTLRRVMVHPDFQRRGYGAALMAEVEQTARKMGLESLVLDCRGGTGADLFYRNCGYREYGRLADGLKLTPGEYRDQILMALKL